MEFILCQPLGSYKAPDKAPKDALNDLKNALKEAFFVIKEHPDETFAQLAKRLDIGLKAMRY